MERRIIYSLAGIALLLITFSAAAQNKSSAKIEQLIRQMTLQEKLHFVAGYEIFSITPIKRLDIPQTNMSDGPVGIRNYGTITAYPATITLAASFDKSISFAVGKALASEARINNVHMILGPGMNIHRSPLCGRNFEYMGEDPYLAGQIAGAFIKGIQQQGVIAVAKHYAANNQEYERHDVSSNMDERILQEIYLPAFKTCVQDAKVAAVMTSYNPVNDVHASQNEILINQILKKDWGFKGFVMTDWASTYDGVACAKAGLDLEMPEPRHMHPDTLLAAINNGNLDIKVIEDKIRRILNMYDRFDYFKNPDISKGYTVNQLFNRNTALEAARGGIVLLKNKNYFLPLDKNKIKKIVIIGPDGHPATSGGGGSSYTTPLHPMSLHQAVKKIAGSEVEVIWEQGVDIGRKIPVDFFETFDFYYYKNGEKQIGVMADFYANRTMSGKKIISTTYKNMNMQADAMFFKNLPKYSFSAKFSCYFQPKKTAKYLFGIAGDDGYRLFIDGKAVINEWHDQDAISRYDTLLEAHKEYKIELEYYQGSGRALLQFSAALAVTKELTDADYRTQAIEAAKNADLVVFAVGFDPNTESEGFDRTFDLPYNQNELIKACAAVNANNVMVLFSGGNVNMNPWIDATKGLIHAWYPGQEGALAVAEILFGITNPSGKLPVSFEKNAEDNPTYNNYKDDDKDGKVFYKEGIFMGYRFYDKAEIKPRFPFGFGLSYTTFAYSDLIIKKTSINKYNVSVTIKNTGKKEGAEAVQLYVGQTNCSVPRPQKELKDFAKINLQPGETKIIKMQLDENAFHFFHPEKRKWMIDPGEFTIYIGASSEDIRLNEKIIL
ncbi:MAG: glycoside hydrolase family 3 C-terminal domain-containing protein [Ferruginibacter sp.]|nr:glycoside hydrolase family 3 C-terminal domain-containing protein [Ferruginibacter sp.]